MVPLSIGGLISLVTVEAAALLCVHPGRGIMPLLFNLGEVGIVGKPPSQQSQLPSKCRASVNWQRETCMLCECYLGQDFFTRICRGKRQECGFESFVLGIPAQFSAASVQRRFDCPSRLFHFIIQKFPFQYSLASQITEICLTDAQYNLQAIVRQLSVNDHLSSFSLRCFFYTNFKYYYNSKATLISVGIFHLPWGMVEN